MPKKVNVVLDKNPLEDDLKMMIKVLPRDKTTGVTRDRFWRLGLVYYKMIKNHINKNGLSSDFKNTYAPLSVSEYDLKTEVNDKATDLALSVMIFFMLRNRVPAGLMPSLVYCKSMEEKISLNDKVFLLHFIMDSPIKPILQLIEAKKLQILAPNTKMSEAMKNKRFNDNAGNRKTNKDLSYAIKEQIVEKADKEMSDGKTQKQIAQELGLSAKYLRTISKEIHSSDQDVSYSQIKEAYLNEHRKYEYPTWNMLESTKYDAYFEDVNLFDGLIRVMLPKQVEFEGIDAIRRKVLFFDSDRHVYTLYLTTKNLLEIFEGNEPTDEDIEGFLESAFEAEK